MYSAKLSNGKIVTTSNYDLQSTLYCMDKTCKANVIYVAKSELKAAHFKTTGKRDSVHKDNCIYVNKHDFKETLKLVSTFQKENIEQNVRDHVIQLNLNKLDPDYVSRGIERTGAAAHKEIEELEKDTLKEPVTTPKSISSLKTLTKLFKTAEPDLLASIIISVKGNKIPISELICNTSDAHDTLWGDSIYQVQYFVHGVVSKIINREKVKYINLESENSSNPVTLIIFDKYLKHFTYNDKDLLNKEILACGFLKKNEFGGNQGTEIIIKSAKFVEIL